MRRDHGGDRRGLAHAAGRAAGEILDLSASINPIGVSQRVGGAIAAALPAITHYPDPGAEALVEALSCYHGVAERHIVAGNGSTELIYLVARALAPRRALVVHPAFSEYEAALAPLGCRVERLVATAATGWVPECGEILRRAGEVDLIFLANPGNPSGALVPPPLLGELAAACDRAGTILALDEAFVDFVEARSLKAAVPARPGLAIFRSLTKFFALPGLRVGYALLGERVRACVEAWRQPWSVNTLAAVAGAAALADTAYQAETRRLVPEWRAALAAGLEKFEGVTVYPSSANYLLVRVDRPGLTSSRLAERLLGAGVAVRDCSFFPGLGREHVRIAVARPDGQQRLLAALERSLSG